MKFGRKLLALGLGAALILSLALPCFAASTGTAYIDVAPDAWYADAVDYVTENNLMNGSSGAFNPNGTMSRAMLATVLYRAAGEPDITGEDAFPDIAADGWYSDAVVWASQNEYINGYDNGRFGTNDPVTREQFAAILWRYAGNPDVESVQDFADETAISDYARDAVDWARSTGIISGRGGNLFAPKDSATRAEAATILRNFLTANDPDTPGVVQTTVGLVRGEEQDGVLRYLGVPYAQTAERFVPAGEVEPWEGVRLMDNYGNISPQGSLFGMGNSEGQPGTDNNCQNLNIWTPGADGEKRPVMVWLHGDGFSTGSGNEQGYDGANLSRSGDVVVVTVNHRLNLFGHLDLSAYGEKYQYSGNVGVMDIIAALEWVQDNIEAFGGNPDNVTVFGQSGGGAKVLALMTSPYAQGLFHKGIVQSGATETMGVTFTSKEASASLTERILDSLGITADNIEDIQSVSAARLQEAATRALQETGEEYQIPAALGEGYNMEWGPVVEGDFLPTNPVTDDSFAAAGADIPLLIGSTLNEWNFFPGQGAQSTPEIDAAIRAAYPNKRSLTADRVDTLIRLPMLKIMSHKADQGGADVYAYIFARDNSFHGAEIPFVFANTDDPLADQVSQVWVNFARNAVPSAEGMPEWEPYTRDSGATMLLDDEPELVHHHDKELMELLAPDYEY